LVEREAVRAPSARAAERDTGSGRAGFFKEGRVLAHQDEAPTLLEQQAQIHVIDAGGRQSRQHLKRLSAHPHFIGRLDSRT